VSDRQWGDILGILKTLAAELDYVYMRTWAARLGLSALLKKAIDAAVIG
jgi:hypothetical protein